MSLSLAYRVANAPLRPWPFAHIAVDGVLEGFRWIQGCPPDPQAFTKLGDTGRVPAGAYPQRSVFYLGKPEYMSRLAGERRALWQGVADELLSDDVMRAFLGVFAPVLQQRFQGQRVRFRSEACLMRDAPGYALGPHTDSPRKVVSALFYLNGGLDDGTSLYVPKDRSFTCPGGPHHQREDFDRVTTIPFRPDTLFAFAKTDRSFHGVEPVPEGAPTRELLLYDVYLAGA